MSAARNLIESCETGCFRQLHVGTKQIFGLCDRFGVHCPERLFRLYCQIVVNALKTMDRDVLVGHMHNLVWDPGQGALCGLVRFSLSEWRSMLTSLNDRTNN
jgi:hypothetical protein